MQTPITPQDGLVAEVVGMLDQRQKEDFEERAAIMEFDGRFPRGHAECLALLDVLRRHSTLAGISALQIELDGATHWVLTTDPEFAREYLRDIAAIEVATADPREAIRDRYRNVAVLTTLG